MTTKKVLITGGTGFIGSAVVKKHVVDGHSVRVLDNNSRGNIRRIKDIIDDIEFIEGDIRDPETVFTACKGMDSVIHLAYVNGTEFFYSKPEIVLDIAVKGMLNILEGCIKEGIPEFALASSSEVYQTSSIVPTPETVPLMVPDPINPRYSYGGGKIICELMAINYGRKYFDKVIIFRPHNVYGPDMGWEHVIPQFALRMKELSEKNNEKNIHFPIQGSGQETRAFIFIDDFVAGLTLAIDKGKHLGIYHIGTMEEVTIEHLAVKLAQYFEKEITIIPGKLAEGGTLRRCPDIGKLKGLGFSPKIALEEGLKITVDWYVKNIDKKPK